MEKRDLLKDEYLAIPNATILIYKNAEPAMLDFRGTADEQSYTSRTLVFSMIGHNIHHSNFIKTMYLERK